MGFISQFFENGRLLEPAGEANLSRNLDQRLFGSFFTGLLQSLTLFRNDGRVIPFKFLFPFSFVLPFTSSRPPFTSSRAKRSDPENDKAKNGLAHFAQIREHNRNHKTSAPNTKISKIFVGICSNEGNKLQNLADAINLLTKNGFEITDQSIVIETKAITLPDSPSSWDVPYLNMVVAGFTKEIPDDFLKILQNIEISLGRSPDHAKWSPRVIDLDILLWGEDVIDTKSLKVPHPEILNRPFLLHLLAMMDRSLRHPVNNRLFTEMAHKEVDLTSCFSRSFVLYAPKLVGVVNVTPDSFSDGGNYLNPEKALQQIMSLSEDGASIIEIGAQSTRPGAAIISPGEEYQRLKSVLDLLGHLKINDHDHKIKISIDSFSPEVIYKLLENYNNISWINDVTGKLDNELLKFIASRKCKIVTMHSLSVPPSKYNIMDHDLPTLDAILNWMQQTSNNLLDCGFKPSQIILDPGIGFGKSAYQNLDILRQIPKLKELGLELLLGHSRKSYISAFYNNSSANERDQETIAISSELAKSGVDYLRVHNVKDHMRFFVASKILQPSI